MMALQHVQQRTPEWHALRARNIGGSEVAALFGVEPAYAASLYELHNVKAGKAPPRPVDNERVTAGIFLEPAIASMAAAQEGWSLVSGRYATDDDCPGLAASLDFEATHPSASVLKHLQGVTGPGAIEAKNVDYLVFRNTWTEEEPPVHQLLQLQTQLAASGFEWGCLAALVGGNKLVLTYYRRREPTIASIRERVTQFWERVRGDNGPPPDGGEGASHVLKHLFPELEYDPADLRGNEEASMLCHTYMQRAADEKEAKAGKDDAKHKLMALIGPHRKAQVTGYNVTVVVTAPTRVEAFDRKESRSLRITERTIAV